MDFLSSPIFISSAIAALLLLVLFLSIFSQHDGKKYHPIGGTVIDLLINYNKLHHYMTDLAEKYKTYRIIGLFHADVYTSDPVNVEYILKTNFENYGKGTHNHDLMKELLADGIFTVDGENGDNKGSTNMDLFMKATTDSIFKVGFGIDLDNLSGSNKEGVRFSRAFDDANVLTFRRYIDKSWKIKKYLNIGSEAELKKNMKIVDEFIYKVIQIKIAQMQKPKDEFSYKKDDILSRPIAITMLWFIYELSKHPEVQERMAKEIKAAINMKEEITNVVEFAARVTEGTFENMQYLQAALTETVRLYPALPVDPKICFSDDVLPDGCSVTKGSVVAFTPYAMGKMKFIWGDDAYEFKPERWIDRNGLFRTESPFKFTAFQAVEDLLICLVRLLHVQVK
ncbi:cytochrome P450 [Tanacetum coccineum]|uniref:Cytochrome P450 n=1 Tax=Tanacetum coccineum TaxID=301880 RepID=A0ABQ5DX07_9ASTR